MNNRNSPYSIASLTCGIVSLFILPFIFGIASIILGIIGISQQEEKSNYAVRGIIVGILGVIWSFFSASVLQFL